MIQEDHSIPLIATTLYGLEETLAGELAELGAADVSPENGAVRFKGDKRLMYRVNLECRTAIRVLYPVAEFPCRDENELYRETIRVDWSRYLDFEMTMAVDAVVRKSALNNSMYAAQKCKDAIVDQIRSKTGRRPSVDIANPALRLNLFINANRAVLSLDSSGESLHRRGYRTEGGKAPLNEILAAGIVKLSGWNGENILIDPMCGSGTILIEAALLVSGTAPGLIRKSYGFQKWKDYDRELFKSVFQTLKTDVKPIGDKLIHGSDKSGMRIDDARANARRAGVGGAIAFSQGRFQNSVAPASDGTVIMNPPYGDRIKSADLKKLYREIGDTLKNNYQGYTAWIFTGNLDAAKYIGLRTSQRIKLFNGPIECRLLKFELYSGSRKLKYRDNEST